MSNRSGERRLRPDQPDTVDSLDLKDGGGSSGKRRLSRLGDFAMTSLRSKSPRKFLNGAPQHTAAVETSRIFKPTTWARQLHYQDLASMMQPYFNFGHCVGLGYPGNNTAFRIIALLTAALIAFDIFRGCSFIYNSPSVFNGPLVFKCLVTLYASYTAIGYCVLRRIDRSQIKHFICLWQCADEWHECIWHFKYLRMAAIGGLAYTIGVSVINGIYVGLGSIRFVLEFPFMESYFYLKELEFANGLIVLHTSFAFFMPQALYLSICLILILEYQIYNDYLLKLSVQEVMCELPILRYRHLIVTKMTDQADTMLSSFTFAIYTLSSPTLVMVMYLLVRDWQSMTPMSLFTFVCWSFMLLAQIATVSLPAAVVNWQAHRARTRLDQLSTSVGYFASRQDVLFEMSLFATQLTKREIGISGGGFFVINKSFILTIMSMILTYFSVLIQFDLGSGSCACACYNFNTTIMQLAQNTV